MPDLFRDKYRIPSNRLRGWNYANNGHYYITIVTYDRIPRFGHIQDGEVVLNDMGQMVYEEFFQSFEMRSELFLGAFVLMPDHLHAIINLDRPEQNDDAFGDVLTDGDVLMHGLVETHGRIETHGRASLRTPIPQPPKPKTPQPFHRQPKSISSFVAGFKSATVKRIDDWIDANNVAMEIFNKNNPLWQSNYYDHIIRNEMEYRYIEKYIEENPQNEDDEI